MANEANSPEGQLIVAASTVIVFRNALAGPPELLMVRRSKSLAFAASAAVFPGGKIAPADLLMANGDDEQAARIAAVRETLEETGLVLCVPERVTAEQAAQARAMVLAEENLAPVLARFGWTLDTNPLVIFARWVPRFKAGRIFDTRFYLADVGSGQIALEPDYGENTQVFWISASAALEAIECGELKAIYPTRRNLERLAKFASFADSKAHVLATPLATVTPWIEWIDGVEQLRIPEGLGYPVTIAPASQVRLA